MKRRKFSTHQPIERDVIVLVLVEYEWEEGKEDEAVGRVLTEDGWQEFQAWEILPGNMPSISGRDAILQGPLDACLAEFEARIQRLLKDV